MAAHRFDSEIDRVSRTTVDKTLVEYSHHELLQHNRGHHPEPVPAENPITLDFLQAIREDRTVMRFFKINTH